MAERGTVSILVLRPAVAALEELGVDSEPALRKARLSQAALISVENRVPYAAMQVFWQAAAEASGDPLFGLHAGENLARGAYDLIDYLFSVAANVRDGLTRVTEYVRLIYDHSSLRLLVEPDFARICRRTPLLSRHYDEFTVALLVTRIRQATNSDFRPNRVAFMHAGAKEAEGVSHAIGCPVSFGMREMEVRFSLPTLDLPHVRADSRLLAMLLRYANSLAPTMPAAGDSVARAATLIAREIATRLPTLPTTATAMRLSPRTLQRQLAARGVSHSALLDEVRRGLAMKFIGDAALSLSEIGYLLHFADTSVFHRAFRRWTGDSPLRYRQRLYGAGAAR